mmetsp:Transcript_48647/g.141798  ORF Transcript_48647/g.141798 Transcript_48647/m.141798 type:complete len:217 (+) Transcript_48647:984-1634(+)
MGCSGSQSSSSSKGSHAPAAAVGESPTASAAAGVEVVVEQVWGVSCGVGGSEEIPSTCNDGGGKVFRRTALREEDSRFPVRGSPCADCGEGGAGVSSPAMGVTACKGCMGGEVLCRRESRQRRQEPKHWASLSGTEPAQLLIERFLQTLKLTNDLLSAVPAPPNWPPLSPPPASCCAAEAVAPPSGVRRSHTATNEDEWELGVEVPSGGRIKRPRQ